MNKTKENLNNLKNKTQGASMDLNKELENYDVVVASPLSSDSNLLITDEGKTITVAKNKTTKRVKTTKKTIKGEVKLFANPHNLNPNTINQDLYNNKEEERKKQEGIAESYKDRISRGLTPNKQPLIIWRDGLTEAGHTRTAAGKLADCDVWVTFSDEPYPDPEKPYTNFETTTSTNIYREFMPSVKLNEYDMAEQSYMKEYGIARPPKLRDKHIKKLGTTKGTLDKLREIKNSDEGESLLKEVDSGNMAIKTAWAEATGRNNVKVISSNNLDREWDEYYTDDVFKISFNRISNIINTTLNQSTKIDGEDYFPYRDFTHGATSTIISHIAEMIISAVLKSEGHDVIPAQGHATDPDIYHRDIEDKVEIKVTKFDGPNTNWKGGKGIREGQYILITYDETATNWCVMFTTLLAKDWKKAGGGIMAGHTLPIKNVYDNHHNDNKNYKVVYGDVKLLNGKININMDAIK
jgi:hypothetical protein